MLDEWDRFNECQGSESVRPSAFTSRQQYAFLVLADGGDDLETYRFQLSKGWVQAAAVFWQVADALARAEEYAQFEVS
jgi:serine/threonine-protein kinase haspin